MKNLVLLPALLVACDPAEDADRRSVKAQQEQYAIAQPVPAFDYSLERAAVIFLYEKRNTNARTHTVWRGGTSVIEGDCPSIGYPIPFDTSLTNPLKYVGQGGTIEQAEPNGLYPSKNSIATWVRCVSPKGEVYPVYVEGMVSTYPCTMTVDYERNRASCTPGTALTVQMPQKGQ